jgi:hypothetical protein
MPHTLVYGAWLDNDLSPHVPGEVLVRAALTGKLYDKPFPIVYDLLLLCSPWVPMAAHHAATARLAACIPPGLKDRIAMRTLRQIARDRDQPPERLLHEQYFPQGLLHVQPYVCAASCWSPYEPSWCLDVGGTAHAIGWQEAIAERLETLWRAAYRDARQNLRGWASHALAHALADDPIDTPDPKETVEAVDLLNVLWKDAKAGERRVIELLKEQYTPSEVASTLGVSRAYVSKVRQQL